MTTESLLDTSDAPRRWPWFVVGVTVFLLGLILNFVQFGLLEIVATPWYVPIMMTLGVICMFISVLQRGGILRMVGILPFALMNAGVWYMLLIMFATPPYSGLSTAGNPLPSFAAKLADGTPFSNADLTKGESSVMLFYRGHW